VFGFQSNTSYEEMMIGGFQSLLNNAEVFEKASFPNVFIFRTGIFCQKRRTPLQFPEYYNHIIRLSTYNPTAAPNWFIWCQLIEIAALITEKKVREGSLDDERRHFSFLQSCCAVCGPNDQIKRCSRCHVMGYCGRKHQEEDFEKHKKKC
jgi:hypothetical protein